MSVDMAALRTEITTDPLNRGYSAMDDNEIVADLNTLYRTANKTSMTGSEVLNNINVTEWNALDDTKRAVVWNVVHLGNINPFGVEAALMIASFGGGSATITALAAARKTAISRAQELGLTEVSNGHVNAVR